MAHELAHYLRHYWEPRQRAEQRLGESIHEVLDGDRPATPEEKLNAVLPDVRVGFHVHLLDRNDGGPRSSAVAAVEHEADLLAFELLAPARTVLTRLPNGRTNMDEIAALLETQFGLPGSKAREYAALLTPAAKPVDPLLRRIGLVS